jgi:hypothetical protein
MQTYIFKEGSQQGPYTKEELDQLLQDGKITGDDLFWQEGRTDWAPLSEFPGFVAPPSSTTRPLTPPVTIKAPSAVEATTARQSKVPSARPAPELGYAILAIPFIGALLSWLGIEPLLSELGTIVVTAILVFIDARRLGIGGATDLNSKGKRRNGPGQWLAFTLLFWLIGFPAYLFIRTRRGVKNLALPGIVAVIVFLGTPAMLPYLGEYPNANTIHSKADAKKFLVGTWTYIGSDLGGLWEKWVIKEDNTVDIYLVPASAEKWGKPDGLGRAGEAYDIISSRYSDTAERYYAVQVEDAVGIIQKDGTLRLKWGDQPEVIMTRGDKNPFSK